MAETDAVDIGPGSHDVVPEPQNPVPVEDAGGQGMLHFLEREALHDSIVRITTPEAKDYKCHKVILCASSRFFYEKFIVNASSPTPGVADVVELPPLPDDAEVRRLVDVALVFPIALRYAYSNQVWESIEGEVNVGNAVGLFVLAEMLGIPSLIEKTFDFIRASALNAGTAIRLLYIVTRLGEDKASDFAEARERCIEALQRDFASVCTNVEDLSLLGHLPLELLVQILDADELCVPSEASVLQSVRCILEGKFGGAIADTALNITDMRLRSATAVLPKLLEQAAHGIIWELQLDSQIATSAPLAMKPDEQNEYVVEKDFPLKAAAPGATSTVQVAVRACAATDQAGMDRNVLFSGFFPLQQLFHSGPESVLSVAMHTAGGDEVGAISFKCNSSSLSEAKPDEGSAGEKLDEGTTGDKGFSAEEARCLLQVVRFMHLSHEELLRAAAEPLLTAAGAQEQVLQALSVKLQPHEPSASALSQRPPRPSTLRGATMPALSHTFGSFPLSGSPSRQPLALDAQVGSMEASPSQPLFFQRCYGDFDEGGLLYWLGTAGRTRAWRNPMGLGQVLALTSGVGFGMLEDLVGRNVVNLRTRNSLQSYFGVDLLGERLLILEGYCLRNRSSTSHALTHWVFQGSSDGKAWDTLDERENRSILRKPGATAYFEVQSYGNGGGYRCFRIVQAGLNSSGSDNLALSGLELYGRAVAGKW